MWQPLIRMLKNNGTPLCFNLSIATLALKFLAIAGYCGICQAASLLKMNFFSKRKVNYKFRILKRRYVKLVTMSVVH